jgi:hypothetical protein
MWAPVAKGRIAMIRTPFKKDKRANKMLHRSRKFLGSLVVPGNFSEVWERVRETTDRGEKREEARISQS